MAPVGVWILSAPAGKLPLGRGMYLLGAVKVTALAGLRESTRIAISEARPFRLS